MSRLLEGGRCRTNTALLVVLLLSGLCFADEPIAPRTAQQSSPQATESKPDQKPADPSEEKASAKPGNKITPEQAEQLFRDVDTILGFASKDTALPIKHEVKRRLAS